MSPPASVTLSWAEILLVLLLVIGGVGAWKATRQMLADDPSPASAAGTAEDEQVRRARGEIDSLREALVEARIAMAREQAMQVLLLRQNPGLRPKAPVGVLPPQEARNAFEASTRNLEVTRAVMQSITVGIATTEAALDLRHKALAAAENKKSADDRLAKTRLEQNHLGIATGVVLVLLIVAWCALMAKGATRAIHAWRIIWTSFVILAAIIAYEIFGAPALMLTALVLGALVLRAVAVKS